ncbi:hypothetical protein E4U17_003741 [Claviceps sp. LM77 group G4]|nr:hypothetical protein E4U33_001647 [Claviceps sp. LM78 group G4]KAG6054495.1 hypothetical protein E4U17_003741 [Claviceps sp. LM77 group G4]KAG6063733.1 hypothetical protein E4U16_000823 [Claviceps sp. LM84 group G4]
MQLSSAFLVGITASVASAAVASPNLVERNSNPFNLPYCDRGSSDGGICEGLGLHGYCCTTTPSPGYNLRDVTGINIVIACGSNGGQIYCGF